MKHMLKLTNISRRHALGLLGAAGAVALVGMPAHADGASVAAKVKSTRPVRGHRRLPVFPGIIRIIGWDQMVQRQRPDPGRMGNARRIAGCGM